MPLSHLTKLTRILMLLSIFKMSFNHWFIDIRTQQSPHVSFSYNVPWVSYSVTALQPPLFINDSLLRKPGHLSHRLFRRLDLAASSWQYLICSATLCVSWVLVVTSRGLLWSQFTFWTRVLPRWCRVLPWSPLGGSKLLVALFQWRWSCLWVHPHGPSHPLWNPLAFHLVALFTHW